MWGAVAPSWGEHADAIDERVAAVTSRMLALAAPAAGERVLELACGAGGTGIAAAEIVGPEGEVVLTDVVEPMTAIAARRGRGRAAWRTCRPACAISTTSTSRTGPSTSCSAARG